MPKKFDKSQSLLLQISIALCSSILFFQFGLYALGFHEQKSQLLQLRSDLHLENKATITQSSHSHEITPLSDQDIEKRMKAYGEKFFNLTLLSTFFLISGIVMSFLFISRKYINPKAMIEKSDSFLSPGENQSGTQLIHAAKLSGIGEFASTIVHDLKNPLTMVFANLDLISLKYKKNVLTVDEAMEHIERIRFSSTRIKRLVNHMNRISRDDFDLSPMVSIQQVFENSLIILESRIKSNEVEIRNNIPENISDIQADANSLEQVIMNLVGNSIDAMEHSPVKFVEVRAESDIDNVRILLRDSGPGIPDKIIEKIFSPFFTSKEEGKGTGLGLSICQKIIDAHNGKIEVFNHHEGGAEFIITLPKKHSLEHLEKMAS